MTADTTWLNKLTVVASASFLNILFVNSVTPKDNIGMICNVPPFFLNITIHIWLFLIAVINLHVYIWVSMTNINW